MPRIGEIRRLSSYTYVKDTHPLVHKFLTDLGINRSTIGDVEIWVRYGSEARGTGRTYARVVAVGHNKESVEVKSTDA